MTTVTELVDFFRRLGTASVVHSPEERDGVTKAVEVLKDFEVHLAKVFLEAEPQSCLVYSYSFDNKSTLVSSTTSSALAGVPTVTRKGKLLYELLMQRVVLMRDVAGQGKQVQQLFGEHRLLTSGKDQWHVLGACAEFLPLPRSLGHEGPLVQHVVADRAQLTAVARLLRCRQELFYSEEHGACHSARALEMDLSDFFLFNGCVLHDAQNALKWAIQPYAKGEALQDCHIIMESLRNSATPIFASLSMHLKNAIVVRNAPAAPEDQLAEFWTTVGAPATSLDLLVSIDPWHDGQAMSVNQCVERRPDPLAAVAHCTAILMRWRVFTESRFLSMTTAASGLLGSLAIGLRRLVSLARASPMTSTYHLNGFNRLNSDNVLLMVILTVVGGLINAVHTVLMEDNRLLLHLDAINLTIREELEAAHDRPPFVWQRLASLVDSQQDWQSLRSQALSALHTAAAYLHEKTLQPLTEYPWSLAMGSADSRLSELEALLEAPIEGTACKMWKLLKAGYPRGRLSQVIDMIRQLPFTSLAVEQAHASSAMIKKFHPGLDIDLHLQRTFLHQCRHLFGESSEDKREESLRQAIADKSVPPRPLTARHAFLKDLVATAAKRTPDRCLSQSTMRQLMEMHGTLFESLTPSDVAAYEEEAKQLSHEQKERREGDVQHLFAQLRLWQQRRRQERQGSGAFALGAAKARFSSEELGDLQARLQQCAWSRGDIARKREKALAPPTVPDSHTQAVFTDWSTSFRPPPRPEAALWVKVFCEHRDELQGAILSADPLAEGGPAFRFVYGVQSPRLAVFQEVFENTHPLPVYHPEREEDLMLQAQQWHAWRFSLVLGSYYTHLQLPFEDEEGLYVLQDAYFSDSFDLVCHGLWRPMAAILEVLSTQTQAQGAFRVWACFVKSSSDGARG